MELLKSSISWLVLAIGVLGWTAFLPQIKLLVKTKVSDSLSPATYWITLGMQATVLTHILLQPQPDWKLSISFVTCIACLCITLSLIYYYRRHPGGRKPRPAPQENQS